MEFPQEITNIWNDVVVSHEDMMYIVKNSGSNNSVNIPARGSVSFGFSGTYERDIIAPQNVQLVGGKTVANEEFYTIKYDLISDWGSGYNAQITITNNTDSPIEAWDLEFDFDSEITNIWNAVIKNHKGNKYSIVNSGYNSIIPAKSSITIGFNGNDGSENSEPTNYYLSCSEYNASNKTADEVAIVLDKNSFANYEECGIVGFLKDSPSEINGKLNGYQNVDEFFYKIENRDGTLLLEEDIPIENNWEIKGLDSYSDGCTLTIFAIKDSATQECIQYSIEFISDNDCLDSDNDGLNNYFEELIGTNPNCQDTDNDGLNDFEELSIVGTSPLEYDTNKDGMSDSNTDNDNDGLTNFQELNIGTLSCANDTDGDGLNDYDEVNVYNTNPLVVDTDGDSLSDYEEIQLNLNPLKTDTDDNGIPDDKELIKQEIRQHINDDERDEVTDVSVELSCSGFINNKVTIENVYNIDTRSSNIVGLIGVPVEVKSSLAFDTAEIKFVYDETKLGNTSESDLVMLWYDEENANYVVLDSVVDTKNNTVSYSTTHFSKYLLVDRKIWLDSARTRIEYPEEKMYYYDIAFVVDVSGSMSGSSMTKAKVAMNTFIDAMLDYDEATIISFNSKASVLKTLTNNKDDLKDAISSLNASGGTDTNVGLYNGLNELIQNKSNERQIVIMICDGDVNYQNSTIQKAVENNIRVFTVNVHSSNNILLQRIADETNGQYYYASTSNDICTAMGAIQSETIVSDKFDSDGDGLLDVWEINGMKVQGFEFPIYTNPYKADSDEDGLSDGEEMGLIVGTLGTFPCYSDPNNKDTDGDEYKDFDDANPRTIATWSKKYVELRHIEDIRDRFVFRSIPLSDFNKTPEVQNLYVQNVTNQTAQVYQQGIIVYNYEKNKDIYSTQHNGIVKSLTDANGKIIGAKLGDGKFIYDNEYITKVSKLSYVLAGGTDTKILLPDARMNLYHFLDGTGTDVVIDVQEFLNESFLANKRYKINYDKINEHAKSVLKYGRVMTFVNIEDLVGSTYLDGNAIELAHDSGTVFATGQTNASIVAYIYNTSVSNDEYRYFINDYYDWSYDNITPVFAGSYVRDCDLFALECTGLAKSFYIHGETKFNG